MKLTNVKKFIAAAGITGAIFTYNNLTDFTSVNLMNNTTTVLAANNQKQNQEFTALMPQNGYKLNKNQKVKIPVMIKNLTNQSHSYRISPVNVITNDSLKTQYAKDKPGNSTYLSDLITDKIVKVKGHSQKIVYFPINIKENNLIFGGLVVQADNIPEKAQTLPLDFQVGNIPKLQVMTTNAIFVRGDRYPAMKVSYQTNGVMMQNTDITSQLLYNQKVIAETKTNNRNIAPNSIVNLSLSVKEKLEPGQYQIRTTFKNKENNQTVDTPLKLNAKQLKPANSMINNLAAEKAKKQRPLKTILTLLGAVILSGAIGSLSVFLYYRNKKNKSKNNTNSSSNNESSSRSDLKNSKKTKMFSNLLKKKKKVKMPDKFDKSDINSKNNTIQLPDNFSEQNKTSNDINSDLAFKPKYKKVPDIEETPKTNNSVIISEEKGDNEKKKLIDKPINDKTKKNNAKNNNSSSISDKEAESKKNTHDELKDIEDMLN